MGLQKILNKQASWILDPLLNRPSFYFSLRRLEAHFQFKISSTLSCPSVLQDGHPPIGPGLTRKVYSPVSDSCLVQARKYRYVDSLSRFKGCLLSWCDRTVDQLKVLPFGLSTAQRTFTHLGGRHLPQDLWIQSVPVSG